jgi:hypothetical protein
MRRNEVEKRFNEINSKMVTALGMENEEVIAYLTATEEVVKGLPERLLYLLDEDYFKRYERVIDELIIDSVEKEEGDN